MGGVTPGERALIVVQVRHEEYRRLMSRAQQLRDPENREFVRGAALHHREVARSAAFIVSGRLG